MDQKLLHGKSLGRILAAALLWTLVHGAALQLARAASQTPTEAQSPAAVFARIEGAWLRGDAEALMREFGLRKVSLSLPETASVQGRFSRHQCDFIFRYIFESSRSVEFRFTRTSDPGEARQMAVGLAERKYRDSDGGRFLQDRVLIALVRESDRWVISEIQSLR